MAMISTTEPLLPQRSNYPPPRTVEWEDSSSQELEGVEDGIDFLGIAWRRKWIIILFALIGAGLGYLVYLQTPTTYESVSRIMIWTQAPPVVVNGNALMNEVSVPKHESLILSNLVLSDALVQGKFDEMKIFKDEDSPMGFLKENMSASEVSKSSDALEVSIKGKVEEELPKILSQVIDSYSKIVAKDSADTGNNSVSIMEKIQKQLSDEKAEIEEKYFTLFRKLGLTQGDQNQIVNPFADKIASLTTKIDEEEMQFEEVIARIGSLAAMQSKMSDEHSETFRLMAVVARRYLELPTEYRDSSNRDILRSLPLEIQREHQTKTRQIQELESTITDLESEKARNSRTFGTKHYSIRSIDNELRERREQRDILRKEVAELETSASAYLGADASNPKESISEKNDKEIIQAYALALQTDRDQLKESLESHNRKLEDTESKAASISSDLAELNILKRKLEDKEKSLREVFDRLAEMNALASNFTHTRVRVIDPPTLPAPVWPILPLNLGLGAILASLVGFGLAFLVDWSDQAFRNPQEISGALRAQVLGKVPVIRDALKSKNRAAALITLHRTNSVASEAFRAIRSAVVYNAARDGHKVFMLTSPSPGDGKSTVAANLAMSLAQMGKRIILVDADYRRPRVHQLFDVDMKPGMLNYVQGEIDLDSAIRQVVDIPGLNLLTSGGYPENPGELVTSNQFAEVISELRSRYDFVLIDSPPVLAVADATGMASLIDSVLLTIRIRRGVIVASQKAKEQLDLVNAPVGGIIVNGLDNNPYYSDYGRYGYRHGYGFGYGSYSTYGRYYDSQKEKYHDRPTRYQESS